MSRFFNEAAAGSGAWKSRWFALRAAVIRFFHAYGTWLVRISWWRFLLICFLTLILSEMLSSLLEVPGASQRHHLVTTDKPTRKPELATPSGAAPRSVDQKIEIQISSDAVHIQTVEQKGPSTELQIDEKGVRIPTPAEVSAKANAAPSKSVDINLTADASIEELEHAIATVRQLVEAQPSVSLDSFAVDMDEDGDDGMNSKTDWLPNITMLLIVASVILKITYGGRIRAEANAQAATQHAENEALKRQIMEARMAAMQAQMEPHFLFNTLAGIEHLIETDVARAAIMQKSLIAFLRAAMPTLREANAQADRDLGRELAVVRPYLELMRMRMEERLQFEIQVPEGLLCARFPPMMLQSLVENAIRHGLEPKAEGGKISVMAQVRDGNLVLEVTDTGVGFAAAPPADSGIGLSNIRERLKLLYGARASLEIRGSEAGGACVRVTVPYQLVTT